MTREGSFKYFPISYFVLEIYASQESESTWLAVSTSYEMLRTVFNCAVWSNVFGYDNKITEIHEVNMLAQERVKQYLRTTSNTVSSSEHPISTDQGTTTVMASKVFQRSLVREFSRIGILPIHHTVIQMTR